jgi:hypothetical protein
MSASLKKKLKANVSSSIGGSSSSVRRPASISGSSQASRSSLPGTPRALNDGSFADEMQMFQIGIKDESGRVREFQVSRKVFPCNLLSRADVVIITTV